MLLYLEFLLREKLLFLRLLRRLLSAQTDSSLADKLLQNALGFSLKLLLGLLSSILRELLVIRLQDVLNVEACLVDLLEVAESMLLVVLDDHDLLNISEELELMSHEHNALIFEDAFDALVEDVTCNLRVDSRKRVIQKVDVGLRVDGSSQTNPSLLASRYVDASLADDGVWPSVEVLDVFGELTGLKSRFEQVFFEFLAHENVVLDGRRDDEGLLLNVRHRAFDGLRTSDSPRLFHQRVQQSGLARAHHSNNHHQVVVLQGEVDI